MSLFMDVNNGRVYRSTSARRYKARIEEFVPDPAWLDMPVVTYVDAKDPENGRPQIGTIAEDALEHGAEPLVMWSSEGAEDYRYEREVPVLRWFLREHRDEIAALKDHIEQQDKTITALAAQGAAVGELEHQIGLLTLVLVDVVDGDEVAPADPAQAAAHEALRHPHAPDRRSVPPSPPPPRCTVVVHRPSPGRYVHTTHFTPL